MWDCLVNFSTWAENNSGQIQIVIGLVALIFAYVAYKKVLEQIAISNVQTEIANNQNKSTLKVNLLELVLLNFQKSGEIVLQLDSVIDDFTDLCGKLKKINDPYLSNLERLLSTLKENKETCSKIRDQFFNKIEAMMLPTYVISEDEVKDLYKLLASAINVENGSKNLMYRLDKVVKKKNL